MNRLAKILLAAGSLSGILAVHASAAPTADVYGASGPWKIETWSEGGKSLMCSATIANPSAQPDYASFLRLENDGKGWMIASDYLISGNSADTDLLIDGRHFQVGFTLKGDVISAPVDDTIIGAITGGKRINLNLDPSGQNFSLRGAQAALQLVEDCARGQGLQNFGSPETNEYNGYDIGGTPEAEESAYAAVRGWNVVSASIAGKFAYCAAEFDDGGTPWRLGWDGMQWQAAVAADAKPDWTGELEVDGDRRSISGSAKGGWVLLWLGMPELDKIRSGNEMIVDVGRASIQHRLIGTAAVITKIEECWQRNGKAKSASAAPAAAPKKAPAQNAAAGGGCADDKRLPFTGICMADAAKYLTGKATYGDYLPDGQCRWVVNEVQVVDDALLYRALRCKGVTAQLEYAGGAQWAQLMVVRSALAASSGEKPDVSDPKPLVWFNTVDPDNVVADLDMRSRQGAEDELRGRSCVIKRADPATSPDGYVFNLAPDDPKYADQQSEPTPPQCGPFSEGDGVTRFWRVLGDYAFLFDLSADIYQDIDPNTVTLLKKDASGKWRPAS